MHVCVVVLGDLGHSPRMSYHCVSLADHLMDVDFVGYSESSVHHRMKTNERINVRPLWKVPFFVAYLPSLLALALKFIWQFCTLFFVLLRYCPARSLILLQNPPGIPAIAVCTLVRYLKSAIFICDWHNYTYSMFQLRYENPSHVMVRFSKWFEKYFCAFADAHFTVTEAMRRDLIGWLDLSANSVTCVYDRPPSNRFRPLNLEEKAECLSQLSLKYPVFKPVSHRVKSGKPALVISATSWTEDEDFGVLFDAIRRYDEFLGQDSKNLDFYPKIILTVTGKGPLKQYYADKINELPLNFVKICLPWLKSEEYPKLLACADLGVSLHTSSSGLDLPMKVVDMLGCGVPVLAMDFNCIEELVHDGKNGILFKTATELFENLKECLHNFGNVGQLDSLKDYVHKNELESWENNWDWVAWPAIVDTFARISDVKNCNF